jgi:gliding motility-associated-like protein
VVNSYNGTDNATDTYPVDTTMVIWTVTDISGNISTCEQTIIVIDNEAPVIVCPDDVNYCGDLVPVDQPVVSDNCAVDFIVNDWNDTDDASGTADKPYPLDSTVVVVWTVTDIHGNTNTCSMTVTAWNTPSVSIAGTDHQFCEDTLTVGDLIFMDANTPDIGVGVWSIASGFATFEDSLDPKTLVDDLPYESTVLRWTITNGVCPDSKDSVEIIVDQMPSIANAGEDKVTHLKEHQLDANTPVVGFGLWTVISGDGDFNNPTDAKTIVDGLQEGENLFMWTISNGTCPASFDSVLFDWRDFEAPQGFSPNGDGINDYFEILDVEQYPNAKLTVYNRWGAEVFHSDHYHNEWDGRATNTIFGNNVLPAGTYFYILELGDGKSEPFTGYVYIKP